MRRLYFVILLVAFVGVLWSVTSYADGSCGPNLTWSINEATGELTISGEGAMTSYSFLLCQALNPSFLRV